MVGLWVKELVVRGTHGSHCSLTTLTSVESSWLLSRANASWRAWARTSLTTFSRRARSAVTATVAFTSAAVTALCSSATACLFTSFTASSAFGQTPFQASTQNSTLEHAIQHIMILRSTIHRDRKKGKNNQKLHQLFVDYLIEIATTQRTIYWFDTSLQVCHTFASLNKWKKTNVCERTTNSKKPQDACNYGESWWKNNGPIERADIPASWRICRTWMSSTVLELFGLRSVAAALPPPGLGPWWACSATLSRRHWSFSVIIARRQRSTIVTIDCRIWSTNNTTSNSNEQLVVAAE